jgi:hypothetical protein
MINMNGFVKPSKFTVKISSCGVNTFSGSYAKFEDKSAMQLLFDVVNIVSKDFVGKENSLTLQYDLACVILSSLNGWDKDKLLQTISDKELEKKLIDRWTMKEQ